MEKDGWGELCPLVLPGVARSGRQQVPRAPAHRQRLPNTVPEEGFRLKVHKNENLIGLNFEFCRYYFIVSYSYT